MTESTGGLYTDPDYENRIGSLQRRLRDCESKRLELERKLFESSSSNAHICRLKHTKLKNSLKEACEMEKRARLRNQTFLQDFDRIEAHLLNLISNFSTAQQQKMLQVSRQVEINSGANMSRRMYHPATIFMGRQMSANSSIEHCLTQRKSPQPTKSFSISDPHSARQAAINSNVTDSCVVPSNSDIRCLNKPDIIDGETSFQISQKMLVTSIASSEDGRIHCAQIDKTQSGRKHLVESKQSAKLSTQTLERLSPENRAGDLQNDSPGSKVEEALMYESLAPNEERFKHASPSGSSPDACDYINKQTSDKHSACENLSDEEAHNDHTIQKEKDQIFMDSSSDLTVSISDSEDISSADLLDLIDGKEANPCDTLIQSGKELAVTIPDEGVRFHLRRGQDSFEESSSISAISQNYLSEKAFFYLIQSIEGMVLKMEPDYLELYKNLDVSQTKLDHLISLCNERQILKEEDLEACTALVLHQLQRLLKSILTGSSSPEDILIDSKSNTDEKTERLISKSLKERFLSHISFLKNHQVLKEGAIPACFSVLLMSHEKTTAGQTLVNLAESSNESISDQSSEAPSSLPLKKCCTDDMCSQCQTCKSTKQENSDVSPHYAQPAIQDILHNEDADEEEAISNVSELEIPGLTFDSSNLKTKPINKLSSEASFSPSEKSPASRKENKSRVLTKKKSKAFWGESDDSSSDIEAILRPQPHNADGDDFDDFFD
ncbi:centrosomal protein kizuna isoform 2-T2 [Discoglossus pictus]